MSRAKSVIFLSAVVLVAVGSVVSAATPGGRCRTPGRRVIAGGVELRCVRSAAGLQWRPSSSLASGSPSTSSTSSTTTTVPMLPDVSVLPAMLNGSADVTVTTNTPGTVYLVEVSHGVTSVAEIEALTRWWWSRASVAEAGVNRIAIDVPMLANGVYKAYLADRRGVLSAPSKNDVVISMTRQPAEVSMQRLNVQFGGALEEQVMGSVVDSSGNVYVVGETEDELAGGGSNFGFMDAFVRKYDSSMVLQGTLQFGTGDRDVARSIAIDSTGSIYVVGRTYGQNWRFSDGYSSSSSNPGANADMFVLKLTSSLSRVAFIQFGLGLNDVEAWSIVAGADGSIYVAGDSDGVLGDSSFGTQDGFVMKYDSSLNNLVTKQFGTDGYDEVRGAAVDGAGNVYVTGSTTGMFSGASSGDSYDLYVAKFNSSLAQLGVAQRSNTTDTNVFSQSVAVDGSGNIYVVGYTQGDLQAGSGIGGYDAFIMKFTSALVYQTVNQFGTTAEDRALSVVVRSSGEVLIAGYTFGLLGASRVGNLDSYLVSFDSSLVRQSTVQFGSSLGDYGLTLAVDGSGNTYVSGKTNGILGDSNSGGYDCFIAKNVA